MAGISISEDRYININTIQKLILKRQTERALAGLKAISDAKGGVDHAVADDTV
ncbi:MAG: hypothetical protein PHH84_07630 [Oscillospiraceae bacterium]|nr:hypothetical protein [Oscillospiraceae bacterium]MDD4414064.1 hypothetical protein [Oscillospiraceae bacterium]